MNIDAAKEISKKLEAFYKLEEGLTSSIKGSVVESHESVQKTLTDLGRVYEVTTSRHNNSLNDYTSLSFCLWMIWLSNLFSLSI